MATKKSKPEDIKPSESEFKPVIVQDASSRIIRARRLHSQEDLDLYLSRGWVIRG